ncbi:MAG: glycosyltransferase family 2 protein [Ignavibacteriaceae bacterium]|jgi:glycosyltransferase involved in cell wall biosynthesis|nr:glycosyltransferase family 2 protein [Ignavibacteriaceae bacterium]
MNKNPISVLIIAGNEEKNIRDCLESVKWADEIVVIDSFSTDNTFNIALEYTPNVYQNRWNGFSEQRKYGNSKVRNEWVLALDADERVTPELKEEILALLSFSPKYDSYYIPRRNYFLGKHITTCKWYPDYQLRLFKKSITKVTDRKVHEGYETEGERGKLKNDLIHFTHSSISETINKINHYSTLEAEEKYRGKRVKKGDLVLHPLAAFLNQYISRKGYKDGVHGLMVSLIHSMTNMLTYMKTWELQNSAKK